MIHWIFLICGLGVTLLPAESRALTVGSILESPDLESLRRTVSQTQQMGLQRRACEIQRREGLAPTACYALVEKSNTSEFRIRELDRDCRRNASKAARVPKIDESTSAVCRAAIAARDLDLAYAEGRDALRYP